MLLRLERVHLHRHFRGSDQVRQEDELPAAQLRAIAQVEIFGQRVVLPAAGISDRRSPPDARGAVEVEEQPGAVPSAVLQHEVGVEQDRLDLREQRVVLVDVPPSRLHHRDAVVAEVRNRLLQEVRRRNEVRVEDGDELALRHLHGGIERARLVAGAIGAMDVGDVDAVGGIAHHGALRHNARLVGGVVQHLDFEQLARIVELADGVDQPVRHVHLVVDRKLDRDLRQPFQARRHGMTVLVLHVQVDQVIPVPPVDRENDEDEKVGRENEGFAGRHA